ncbi:MAG: hypothetical protein OXH20_01590 [bacterium]|nr:hypothetical protein [bacterium]
MLSSLFRRRRYWTPRRPHRRGELVLLVDPGAPPEAGDPGRPRQVFEWLDLLDFDGS